MARAAERTLGETIRRTVGDAAEDLLHRLSKRAILYLLAAGLLVAGAVLGLLGAVEAIRSAHPPPGLAEGGLGACLLAGGYAAMRGLGSRRRE